MQDSPMEVWRKAVISFGVPMIMVLLGIIGWFGQDVLNQVRIQSTRIESKVDKNNQNIMDHLTDSNIHSGAINPMNARIDNLELFVNRLWSKVYDKSSKRGLNES